MHINKIEITKSKTIGAAKVNAMKFNKLTVTMAAELAQGDDALVSYNELSSLIDVALENENVENDLNTMINDLKP